MCWVVIHMVLISTFAIFLLITNSIFLEKDSNQRFSLLQAKKRLIKLRSKIKRMRFRIRKWPAHRIYHSHSISTIERLLSLGINPGIYTWINPWHDLLPEEGLGLWYFWYLLFGCLLSCSFFLEWLVFRKSQLLFWTQRAIVQLT